MSFKMQPLQTAGDIGGIAASLVRVPTEGYGSFLLRDLPFDAIQFCIYEQLRIGYKVVGQGNQYTGIVSCAQTILREEGPKAFLKGIEPRVLWIGIGGSIFGVLEKTKSMLAEKRNRELRAVKDE
ncbi:unnamed protein product [Miscanthus lutarioriparius]|uniref:Mitochondrial carrier protein n=1 Tax=Miscanthus lutarioriparius TaxID=422564 RepID=A0A811PIK8_9POAL|nr:unnamed protein product [Miscanthus lutarioriparius]